MYWQIPLNGSGIRPRQAWQSQEGADLGAIFRCPNIRVQGQYLSVLPTGFMFGVLKRQLHDKLPGTHPQSAER